jgi:hypothetical protein
MTPRSSRPLHRGCLATFTALTVTLTIGSVLAIRVPVTHAAPLNLVTVSGHVSAGGSFPLAGHTVALQQCTVDGVTGGGSTTTDGSGFYSLQVPAGCTGQFSFGTIQQNTSSAVPILGVSNPAFVAPLTDTTIDIAIPDLVTIDVDAQFSDATPVPVGEIYVNDDDPWPPVTLSIDGQDAAGLWFKSNYNLCSYTTPTTCQFLVPRNSTTVLRAWANLGGGIAAYTDDTITVTTTNTSAPIVLPNLAEVASAGANSGSIIIVTPPGTEVSDDSATPTTHNPPSPGESDLTGAVDFTVSGVTPGDQVEVALQIPDGLTPTHAYWILDGVYVDISATTDFSDGQAQVVMRDGGFGDADGVANGVIVDPLVITHSTLPAQAPLQVNPSASVPHTSPITLTTSGGSGSGRVAYVIENPGTAQCSVSGSTLTASAAGVCRVIATKYGDGSYLLTSSAPQSFTFTTSPGTGGGGGGAGDDVGGGGAGGAPQLPPSSPSPTPAPSPSPSPAVPPGLQPMPVPGPGMANAVLNGAPVNVDRVPTSTGTGMTVRGGDFSVTLEAVDPSGKGVPLGGVDVLRGKPGGSFEVAASGLLPDSPVAVYLNTRSYEAGGSSWLTTALAQVTASSMASFTTDDSGSFSGSVLLPTELPSGDHSLQIASYRPPGDVLAIAVGFRIESTAPKGSIVITGSRLRQQPAVIKIAGLVQGLDTPRLRPWYRSEGRGNFVAGKETVRVNARGGFRWELASPHRTSIYFTRGATTSNAITIAAARQR